MYERGWKVAALLPVQYILTSWHYDNHCLVGALSQVFPSFAELTKCFCFDPVLCTNMARGQLQFSEKALALVQILSNSGATQNCVWRLTAVPNKGFIHAATKKVARRTRYSFVDVV